MSEKNIIKTARFHHITAGMRFAEFILRETEGLTQTPPLAGQPTILKPICRVVPYGSQPDLLSVHPQRAKKDCFQKRDGS